MDALGPFVLLGNLPETREGTRRHLARQVFVDDISGVVEVTALTRPPSRDLIAAWASDADARARAQAPAVCATLALTELDGTLVEVTERGGATSFNRLLPTTSTGDLQGFAVALASTRALALALASVHATTGAIGALSLEGATCTHAGRVVLRHLISTTTLRAPELSVTSVDAPDAAADVYALGRVFKALLSGGVDEDLRPRVPTAHRGGVKDLLLGLLARRPSARISLDEAEARLAALVDEVCARAEREGAPLVESPASWRALLTRALAPEPPRLDEAPSETIARLRAECPEVKTPPPPYASSAREPTSTDAPPSARSRGSSNQSAAGGTVVARKRGGTAPDVPAHARSASSSHSSNERADDDGVVFEDVPSGPRVRAPSAGEPAPSTVVETALVAAPDLTADEPEPPFADVSERADDDARAAHKTRTDLMRKEALSDLVEAGPGFTLAALEPADLDLHVDDDIRVAPSKTDVTPRAKSVERARAASKTSKTDVNSKLPLEESQAGGAVWASDDDGEPRMAVRVSDAGDIADDDEPATRTDRKRRAPTSPAATDGADRTHASEGARRSASEPSVFASDARSSSTGAPRAATLDPAATMAFEPPTKSAKETALLERALTRPPTEAEPEQGERTVLLEGSLEGHAERAPKGKGKRRRKQAERDGSEAGDARPSIVVEGLPRRDDGDRTAILEEAPRRVRSELGSSPWPRAPGDDGEAETLRLENADAARALKEAIARRQKDVAVDETALLDVSGRMPLAPKSNPAPTKAAMPPASLERTANRGSPASKDRATGDTGTLRVLAPRGATVYVDGKLRGSGNVVVDGVDRFRSMNVRVLLAGHRPWVAEVSLSGQKESIVEPSLIRR